MQEFKIRASSAGVLLTKPRTKGEVLAQTVKTYAQQQLKSKLYGIELPQIKSKYVLKGNWMEDEAIDLAIHWLDLPFAIKNTDSFEDDFFTGTPDLIVDGVVYDIKNSWDFTTFPLFDTEITNRDYYAQLQVYMHLTGCRRAALVYTLLDTPEEFQYEPQHRYGHLPKELRVKRFDIEYDDEIIKELQTGVDNVRTYLSTLKY